MPRRLDRQNVVTITMSAKLEFCVSVVVVVVFLRHSIIAHARRLPYSAVETFDFQIILTSCISPTSGSTIGADAFGVCLLKNKNSSL